MSADSRWRVLGTPAPQSLIDTRLALHWAAQIPADAGRTLNRTADDDSHTNLEWSHELGALVREVRSRSARARVGLRLSDAGLLVESEDGKTLDFRLDGRTLDGGYRWVASQLSSLGLAPDGPLTRSPNEPPAHPLSAGEPLRLNAAAAAELSRWYAAAAALLERLADATPSASSVRCWPHHFDLATLIEVAPGRTVGVGMTPGDGSYPEPYWYVTPYPYPESASPGPLEGGGHWHREGWFGAVLPGNALVTTAGAEAQRERTDRFVHSAVAACRALLGH